MKEITQKRTRIHLYSVFRIADQVRADIVIGRFWTRRKSGPREVGEILVRLRPTKVGPTDPLRKDLQEVLDFHQL